MPAELLTLTLCLAWLDARFPLLESAFFASALGLVAMALPGFAMHCFVVRRLRREHAPVWELLGRPSVVYYGSFSGGLTVMRFFRRGEFEALDDPPLVKVCRLYRVYTAIYSGLLALMLVSFCALATAGG